MFTMELPHDPEFDPERRLREGMLVKHSSLNFQGRIKRIFTEQDGFKRAEVRMPDGFEFVDRLDKFDEIKD